VALTLELDVRGGWLSRFELAGLDPTTRLDPDAPAWLQCEDGRTGAPSAELRPDGTLVLSFAKTDAPRRGRHRLGVRYFTALAASDTPSGKRRLHWAMPPWRSDLADVDLWVDAPAQARFFALDEAALDGALSSEQRLRGGRSLLHLHRVQLPRTVAFGFALELPGKAAPAIAPVAHAAPTSQGVPPWPAAVVLALAWLKRAAVRARAARRRQDPVPLLALSLQARAALSAALTAAGVLCYPRSPALGLALLAGVVALCLDRRIGQVGAAAGARDRHATAYDLFGTHAWLDATSPLGLCLLGSAYALALLRIAAGGGGLGLGLELLVLVTPLWLTGTRLHTARTPAAAASRLEPGSPVDRADMQTAPDARVKSTAGEVRRAPDRAA